MMKKITLILILFLVVIGCRVDQVKENNNLPGHIIVDTTVVVERFPIDSLIQEKQKK